MNIKEILSELKSLSNEKTAAHNIKNGATPTNQYGVKMGDIRAIAKKLKPDNDLALQLWETENIDARLLALLLMKPKKLTAAQVESLAQSLDFAQVADWFNAYILKEFPDKDTFREPWMSSGNKWLARCGWSLMAGKIARETSELNLDELLDKIGKEMPEAPPEVQWTMNTALAYIGIYHNSHRKQAIDLGEKLGIYRDYPVSKGCTSPFAPVWIHEMVRRQQQ